MKLVKFLGVLAAAALVASCSSNETKTAAARPIEAQPDAGRALLTSSDQTGFPKVVILGDSLTAGYGLERPQSYPSLLQQRLDAAGLRYEVVNAGVSGDTSAGGLRRLDWSLDGNVRVLIVALGANDGLRGLPVEEMKKNLAEIIRRGQAKGAAVILAGMEAPPNYGRAYTAAFRNAYRELAVAYTVPLVPFLLDGVAGFPDLNIADGLHPNPAGARIVERTVWHALEPVLEPSAR